ncbi:hypothetical protein [Nocardioides plantarum]|uniref:Mce-associated membrane protein n=1 Tax=Nocardioides plantarum TaxID=29299 RepID=A0ABV5KAC1_9ACTN|nr:hypothetical protein [Nocardioides plantarum]
MDDATPRRSGLLCGLLAVLLLLVVATDVVLVRDRDRGGDAISLRPADIGAAGWTRTRSGQAVQAARTAATTYFTLDHRTVKADMTRMRRLGTPEFVEQYDAGVRALTKRITSQRLRLTGRLPRDGTATEYLVSDRAIVLVSVDVTTTRAGERSTTRYRARITVELVDGAWLVDDVEGEVT